MQASCLYEIALECPLFVIPINHMQILLAKIIFAKFQVALLALSIYEGWNFNSGNYLFTTDTK